MKNHYYEFWTKFLGLSKSELISSASVINSNGRYIEKHEDNFIFFYQDIQNLKKVLIATAKNLETYQISQFDLDQLNAHSVKDFKKLTLAFHDIDYGLTSAEQFTPNVLSTQTIELKKISINDQSEVENFKSGCSEDDIDTLDFNLETDVAYGAFLNNKLIGISRYLVIRETHIADITVVVSSDYRNQKLSAPLVSKIVESILADGFVPKYRVQTENFASIKIAERLGFKPMFQIFTWEVIASS